MSDDIRDEIKNICRAANITPSELARKAGLAGSTIVRFVYAKENSPLSLSDRTLERIRAAGAALSSER